MHKLVLHRIFAPATVLVSLCTLVLVFSMVLPARAQSADPATTAGQQIFADRCANCHGATGEGDGEMSDRLPSPPAKLNDLTLLRTAVPAEWFTLISNGNLDTGMPPFGDASSNPLSETQRWQAIAAVYSLGNDETVVAAGEATYVAECAACHGPGGAGDGSSDGAALVTTDLSQIGYWAGVSDEMVLARLQDQIAIPQHNYQLAADALWPVVAYTRRFGYANITPAAVGGATIASATVSGTVRNFTTDTAVTDPIEVQLHAFNSSFTRTETVTTTLDANGRYLFTLTDRPADWVYMATLTYAGLEYSSDIARVNSSGAALDLPIRVYNQVSTPDVLRVRRLHLSLTFSGDQLLVSELYTFDNDSTAVFVGESGDFNQGTARISLPAGAASPEFLRGFGGTDNFFPADEVIQTATGWADTLPLRPGANSLTLVVNYTLPFEPGMSVSHELPYTTDQVLVALPDSGVTLTGAGWQQGSTQMTTAGTAMLNYIQSDVAAGSRLSLTLAGQPQGGGAAGGSSDWLLGGVVLLVAVAVVGRMVWLRRRAAPSLTAGEDEEDWEETAVAEADDARTELLQAMADLDDAYEAGEMDEIDYQVQRRRLKNKIKELWP